MKNMDGFFTIAKGHHVCQDYCYLGSVPHNCMIVSDGCSTSENSDVGARIIALSAYRCLKDYYSSVRTGIPNYLEFGFNIIQKAYDIANVIGIRKKCLNATLLIALEYEDTVNIMMYGDGYLVFKQTDGTLMYKFTKYQNNAPYYLNYWGNKLELEAFLSLSDNETNLLTLVDCNGYNINEAVLRYDHPLTFKFDASMLSWISLMSDGVESFTIVNDAGSKEKIDTIDVITKMGEYKNFEGEFVKRRTKRELRDREKRGEFHEDDLTIATMLLN